MSIRRKQRLTGHIKYGILLFSVPLIVLGIQNTEKSSKTPRAPASTLDHKPSHSQGKPMTSFQIEIEATEIKKVGEEVELKLVLQGTGVLDAQELQVKWLVPDSYIVTSGRLEESLGSVLTGQAFRSEIFIQGKAHMADRITVEAYTYLENGAKLGSIAHFRPVEFLASESNDENLASPEEQTQLKQSFLPSKEPSNSSEESKVQETKSKEPKIFY